MRIRGTKIRLLDFFSPYLYKRLRFRDAINAAISRHPAGNALTPPHLERNVLVGGEVLLTHRKGECILPNQCCIHNPSSHHMVTWRQHWRGDRGLMERICPKHGTGHPDVDHLAVAAILDPNNVDGIHGCCIDEETDRGCCQPPLSVVSRLFGPNAKTLDDRAHP